MAITLKCKCGAALTVTPEMAGRLGTCPKCGKTMRIPKEAAIVGARPVAPPPKPKPPKAAPAPKKAKPPAAEPAPARPAAMPVPPPKAPPAPPKPEPAEVEKPVAAEPVIEAVPVEPRKPVIETPPQEAAPAAEVVPVAEEEALLYPLDIRWPKLRMGPVLVVGIGLAVLAAVVLGSIFVLPALSKEAKKKAAELQNENKTETYVNPTYHYSLLIQPDWKQSDQSSPDKFVLDGKNTSAEITIEAAQGGKKITIHGVTVEAKAGAESVGITEMLVALSAAAAGENGFKMEQDWGKQSEMRFEPFQYTYVYGAEQDRRRAVIRVITPDKGKGLWFVVTFRAPLSDYQRTENMFAEVYESLTTE